MRISCFIYVCENNILTCSFVNKNVYFLCYTKYVGGYVMDDKNIHLKDYMKYEGSSRDALGEDIPMVIYRLMEYSLREQLSEQFGDAFQIQIFRSAGFRAGTYFTEEFLDVSLPFPAFIAALQMKMKELKIGVLNIESIDEIDGEIVLTVADDADCSGMPVLGETVCNYDEGFLSGILSTYFGKVYQAEEMDCWAKGDKICRFHLVVVE